MKKYDYLIVGAGLFGAVFAHEAIKKGKKCLVVERRNHIGGNIYTEQTADITVHKYGAHIFHTDNEKIWNYVNSFAEFNNFINAPIAVYHNEVYNLPFNMNTFAKLWGIVTPDQVKEKIEGQVRESGIGEPKNLEEQAIKSVGFDVYRKLVKGYTEKQWGRDCKDLPPFIIKRLPVRFTYDNRYFSDRYQGIPIGGYTSIIEKMLIGCDIELNCDFIKNRDVLRGLAEKVVYTGAADELFDYCFGKLEYRSLLFETQILDTENFQGNAVVNYTSHCVPYTRIIEHKHFEFGRQKRTVITKEYPKGWRDGDEPYYPINDEQNNALAKRYKNKAEKEEYILGGRLAEYRYYNMDKTIAKALFLADHIIQ